MRKIIEYTLVSADGVFEDPQNWGLQNFQDDAYRRDGLGQLLACDAMLMGRRTYEFFANVYPSRTDSWAVRLNAMPKYVFSSTLETADWENSTVARGDVAAEVTKLKQQEGRDLLIWGHGLLAETLLKQHLLDVLDISIYPVLAGRGKPFLRDGQNANLRLVTTKSFSKGIVKLTYAPQY
ncbi:MAG: dihydrofolate reductase family protein [Propionibacteriaceae bacterium]|jgi:dihydrofolate reductase